MSRTNVKSPANDIDRILFDKATIQNRVKALSQEINEVYKEHALTVIAVANGAMIFTADLVRELDMHVRLDCIRASSYSNSTTAQNPPKIINALKLDIKGTHVLLIDDILDTGNTLLNISKLLLEMKPASLKTCVLLDKQMRRTVDIEADFVGFNVPDEFVVGYGLDFAESYRQLPEIGVLRKELYER